MEFNYNELKDGVRLLELEGALDLNGTYSIQVQFVRACDGDKVRVAVDLSKVSYLSSVGIPMLVNAAKSVVERGGKIVLVNPQKKVADVLDLTGISQIIRIFSDLESALAELALP